MNQNPAVIWAKRKRYSIYEVKLMKNIFRLVLVAVMVLFSCQLPTNETTYSMDGAIQKGPFQKGSTATIQEVDKKLDPTGRMYTTLTNDDLGSFSLASKFSSQYVEVTSKGFYFNEYTNSTASAEISLRSYGDLSLNKPLNLNVLTTIAHGRIKTLAESGKEFSEARDQAESELLELLGLNAVSGLHFYEFSLASGGDDAALLLAMSATLQQGRTVADLSEFIADLNEDFADDGTISDSALITKLRTSASLLNVTTIMNNLKTHYQNRGKTVVVPDFTNYKNILMIAGGVIGKPVFSKASGNFLGEQSITITAPAGAVIRYTVNGSDPSITSELYTGPIIIPVNSTITLKAVAVLNDTVSSISTATYNARDGVYASDYWNSNPGFCITYSSAIASLPDLKEFSFVFQKGTTSSMQTAVWNFKNSSYSDWNYLYGPHSSSSVGFRGGYHGLVGTLFMNLAYLPTQVVFGNTYTINVSGGEGLAQYTASRQDSWKTYSNLLRIDFDTRNLSTGPYYVTSGKVQGTGYVLFAPGVGVVYMELHHSAGTTAGSVTAIEATWSGAVPLITFTGVVTIDTTGTKAFGATVSPAGSITNMSADAYQVLENDNVFSIRQYAKAGYYTILSASKMSGGTYEYNLNP
ncbi:MAG: chitobiase/beta-hexosaminidase C-terminal domain-containing protein, partial [Rectinemataceae bacterium]|nr:chitobiase/beta-hexosaminidase C-terminal domain-containing protein [Rectinemataceae bacterium]